jgi:methylphosphotriester-DNA--protein-cysteine methyltransferase
MQIDETACHAAVDAKDRRYDGLIYIGVTSTDNGAHPRSRPT